MDSDIEERVGAWDSRPFDGGYDDLRDLASSDFSGAVRGRGAWAMLLNGRVVGVFDGDLEEFEDASGTVYEAPHQSLPLLFAMCQQGGDTRAKYYTNDTPISEVDDTLSSGSFTGYVVLSENVLSGDYYLVYHGGRSMSVAYVGSNDRLITDDEAFERADDEVGIYEVIDVDVEIHEIPEEAPGSAGVAGGAGVASGDEVDETDEDAGGDDGAGDAVGSEDPAVDNPGSMGNTSAEIDSNRGAGASGTSSIDGAEIDPDDDLAGTDDRAPDPEPDQPTGVGSARAPREEAPDTGRGIDDSGEGNTPMGETGTDPTDADRGDGSTAFGGGASGRSGSRGDARRAETETTDDASTDSTARTGSTEETVEQDGAASGVEPRGADPDTREGATSSSDASAGEIGDRSPDRREASADQRTGVSRDRDEPSGPTATKTGGDVGDARTSDRSEPSRADTDPSSESEAARSSGGDAAHGDADPGSARYDSETEWREARAIPPLDPDRTAERDDDDPAGDRSTRRATQNQSTASSDPDREERSTAERGGRAEEREGSGEADDALEREVLEREDRIDRLQQQLSNVEGERDRLREERDDLADRAETLEEENDALKTEIRRLEEEVDRLETALEEAQAETSGPDGTRLSPREALAGTDLFVRYDSKGEPTLDAAHGGAASASEVNANLRLDHHTRFEAKDAVVEGQPYLEYVQGTIQYRFVEWLIRKLLYEIRDTGQQGALQDLYDSIPNVDRIEFAGEVGVEYTEDGETVHENRSFDVVVRDRMGDPLVVANINDSRDPATGSMMVDLQDAATQVKERKESLAGAFMVTRSFFQPEALETVDEATGGSLLSRDSRKSYVKVSRKSGYHLCLVEARDDDLYLNVPEL